MGDIRWMSYAELAAARGISTASAIRLARRRKWLRQMGNDGTARVAIPDGEDRPPGESRGDDRADITEAITGMAAAIAALTAARDEARSDAMRERERADALQARLDARPPEFTAWLRGSLARLRSR